MIGSFNISTDVNTESNVGFNVLNRLLESYSLEAFPEYYKLYSHPNSSLKVIMNKFLDYRNSVSHGNVIGANGTISQEIFVEYKELVFFLMDEVKNRIEAGVACSSHLHI